MATDRQSTSTVDEYAGHKDTLKRVRGALVSTRALKAWLDRGGDAA